MGGALTLTAMLSIHVPARGTTQIDGAEKLKGVFQSTFPRGERRLFPRRCEVPTAFNPRSREGNDGCIPKKELDAIILSIHVPARGTTSSCASPRIFTFSFQSTFPRGERPRFASVYCPSSSFNPRSREGNDYNIYA